MESPFLMYAARTNGSSGCRLVVGLVLLCGGFSLSSGCEEQRNEPARTVEPEPKPEARRAALIFPESLRVDDPSVNALLEEAMRLCSEGEYENFRLIWTSKQEPISRGEFQRGWSAMQEIRIRALERVVLATPEGGDAGSKSNSDREIVYVALAEMTLNLELLGPAAQGNNSGADSGEADGRREAVLMIVKELGAWRLAHAPKSMRSWVRKKLASIPPAEMHPPTQSQP